MVEYGSENKWFDRLAGDSNENDGNPIRLSFQTKAQPYNSIEL